MTSFELELVDEKSLAGSTFMARVAREIRRALVLEKKSRKLTQQAIADKIGTSRAVVNREVQGLENLTARRIGELLWAMGWEPHFEARKPSVEANELRASPYSEYESPQRELSKTSDLGKITKSDDGKVIFANDAS